MAVEGSMNGRFRDGILAAALVTLVALSSASIAQTPPPATASPPPSITVLPSTEVQAILGSEVRSAADENMGRIADVLVDGEGRTRAAIIDFGGFLGVGSRKIAVEWAALHFVPAASKRYRIVLELTRDQVKAAPEYAEGKPTIVLGVTGTLSPLP
jgi:PRC-barrel domain